MGCCSTRSSGTKINSIISIKKNPNNEAPLEQKANQNEPRNLKPSQFADSLNLKNQEKIDPNKDSSQNNPAFWLFSKLSVSFPDTKLMSKVLTECPFDLNLAENLIMSKSPYLYLTSSERRLLINSSKCLRVLGSQIELMKEAEDQKYCPFLILEGLLTVTDSQSFCEELKQGDSFGFDSCIFQTSLYTITTKSQECLILALSPDKTLALIQGQKQFGSIIGRNLLYKQKIFEPVEKFLSFVKGKKEKGKISIHKLVDIYLALGSTLHPEANSKLLDIPAWKFALNRLPENITESFVYDFTDAVSDILVDDFKITKVASGRGRTILNVLPGKSLVVLREFESDLNDFLCSLCIHYIECKKVRKRIKRPGILSELSKSSTIDFLPFSKEEKEGILSIWGQKSCQILRNIALHHENFYAITKSSSADLKSSFSEKWIEGVWKGCQKSLGISESVSEAIQNGLKIDMIQGSTTSLLNLISPYFLKNKERILKWFDQSGISLKTQEFYQENDRLFAVSHYFFKTFPEELSAKSESEKNSGIVYLENTEKTGVKVLISNVSKLQSNYIHPKSSYHLLINIGYSFGKQGYDIVKCFTLLFGCSISSFAFIGKAGGLVGNRNEVLLAEKFFDMATKRIATVNPEGIKLSLFENIGVKVHKGCMLTVPGKVLQNKFVLKYGKYIESCVGVEMEGYYYAKAVQESIEMSLVRQKIASRFLYYSSDLPLDPGADFKREDKVLEEGNPILNAVTFQILKLCSNKRKKGVCEKVDKFLQNCERVAFVMKYWDVAQEILNLGCPVVAFVNYKEDVPCFSGRFIAVDYRRKFWVFKRLEEIFNGEFYRNIWMYSIFDYPENIRFDFTEKIRRFEIREKATVCLPGSFKVLGNRRISYIVGCREEGKLFSGAGLCFSKKSEEYFALGTENKEKFSAKDLALYLLGNN